VGGGGLVDPNVAENLYMQEKVGERFGKKIE